MSWPKKFKEAFDSIQEPFGVVLEAGGCREGWLHAELYRRFVRFDEDFKVNCFPLAKGQKADLYGKNPSPMVAEIKIYGTWGYFPKNICGHNNIRQFHPSSTDGRRDVTADDVKKINLNEGSLLKDYQRLKSFQERIEKYVILVIQMCERVDEFGEVIQAIRLSNEEVTLQYAGYNEYPGFKVRIWEI